MVNGTSISEVVQFYKDMRVLEVKDLGEVTKSLCVGKTYDNDEGYHLEQAQSILEILTKLHLMEANPSRTPIARNKMTR